MRRKVQRIVLMLLVCSMIIHMPIENVCGESGNAKIILSDDGESTRERFHIGRIVGSTVNITTVGTQTGITIKDVNYSTSNSKAVTVNKKGNSCVLKYVSEGIAVITMTCKANKKSVTKKLLASSLKGVSLTGSLKNGAKVYEGCSDMNGITSGSELKATNNAVRNVTIDGECGSYYRVWINQPIWGSLKEDFGYVKKNDVNLKINALNIPNEIHIFNTKDGNIPIGPVPIDYPIDKTKLKWTSSNNSIVTVDNSGKIHGCSEGNAIVTMNYDNGKFTGKCKVYVEPYIAVKSIKLIPDRDNIDDGLMGKFDVEILPENASIKKCDWVVSSDKMLQIDQSGRYLATFPGKVNVKVISRDNGLSDSCSLVINEVEATGMVLQKNDEIAVGETKEMSWRMIPANSSNKRGTWTSSNTSIATIDSKGIVKGIKAGTVTITRKSELGFVKTCQLKVINYVEDIEINEGLLDMKIGTTKKLVANIIPGNAFKLIKWKTKDSSIVSVDKNGIIRANKLGETEITVYDQYTGAFDFVIVDVVKKLKKVEKKSKKKKSSKSKSKNDKKSSKKKTAKKKETKKKTAKKSNKKK